jgi:hypothetical protein
LRGTVVKKLMTIYRARGGYIIGLGEREIIHYVCTDQPLTECIERAWKEIPLELFLESEDL